MSKLKCAVIGLGMGKGHALAYARGANSELVAVSDLNAARFSGMQDILKPEQCYTDYKEMLRNAKPDVVSIALPNFLHKEVTIECLAAGAHVLCEKPPAMNLQEALHMKEAAHKHQRLLGINLSQRYRYMNVWNRVQSGGFGDFYHARVQWTRRDGIPGFGGWFGQKAMSGGGPLIDLGVHRIDLAMWLMGSPEPCSASAVLHSGIGAKRAAQQQARFDVEDYATGMLRFTNGTSLLFETSWAGQQREKEMQQMHLIGTEGALEQYQDQWWKHSVDSEGPVAREIVVSNGILLESAQAFVDAVYENKPFAASIDDGLRIQAILDALYLSAEQKREVEVTSSF